MIYSSLMLARNLLTDDGVLFISIDDNEGGNLKKICDEVFGAENYRCFSSTCNKKWKNSFQLLWLAMIMCFAMPKQGMTFSSDHFEDESYKYSDEYVDERGRYNLKQPLDCNSISYSVSLDYPIEHDGVTYYPGSDYEKYLKRQAGNIFKGLCMAGGLRAISFWP